MRFAQDKDGVYLSGGQPLCGCAACLGKCIKRLDEARALRRELEAAWEDAIQEARRALVSEQTIKYLAQKRDPLEAITMIEDEYWARTANAVIRGARHE